MKSRVRKFKFDLSLILKFFVIIEYHFFYFFSYNKLMYLLFEKAEYIIIAISALAMFVFIYLKYSKIIIKWYGSWMFWYSLSLIASFIILFLISELLYPNQRLTQTLSGNVSFLYPVLMSAFALVYIKDNGTERMVRFLNIVCLIWYILMIMHSVNYSLKGTVLFSAMDMFENGSISRRENHLRMGSGLFGNIMVVYNFVKFYCRKNNEKLPIFNLILFVLGVYCAVAIQQTRAMIIVLSGCIAASATGSVSFLEMHQTSLEAKASQRLQAAAAPSYAAAVQSPAALQDSAVQAGLNVSAEPADLPAAANPQQKAAVVEYRICDENGKNWRLESKEAIPVTSDTTALPDGWYVVNGQVNISDSITVSGNVCLILADGCRLAAEGIHVSEEGGTNSLQIFAQSDGDVMGSLVSTAAGDAAGIGGEPGKTNGPITIFGGNVEAAGGVRGAGIGGGNGAAGQNITIHGGRITAKAYTAVFDSSEQDGDNRDDRGGG